MKPKKLAFCVISTVILNAVCLASDISNTADANNLISLEDYLQYAVSHNAGLQAGFEQWQIAAEQIPQAKSLPEPQASYGYAAEPTPQRTMFDFMQEVPWFGTIEARTDAADAAAKSAYKQYEAKKLQIFYEVKQAFYEYSYLARAIEITGENLELLRHFEEVARARYATSSISHPDIIRAQVELAVQDNQLKNLQRLRPAVIAKLNSILNRPVSSELPWPSRPGYEIVSIDSGQLQAVMAKANPQLQSIGFDIEAAKSGELLAQKRFYPNLGLGFAVDAGMGRNGDERIMPKISLTLPVWRDNYKAAERQAKAQRRQLSLQKIQMEKTLAAQAEEMLYEIDNNNRKILLYRDIVIPRTREMVTASITAYQAGSIDFLSLIDAQRTLLDYQLDYEKMLAENAQKFAELEMLAGTQLPTAPLKPAEK